MSQSVNVIFLLTSLTAMVDRECYCRAYSLPSMYSENLCVEEEDLEQPVLVE
jgi:hypothetical protein